MTRFRAYSSDGSSSSDEDEDEQVALAEKTTPQKSPHRAPDVDDGEVSESESSSSASSSAVHHDELMTSPPRPPKVSRIQFNSDDEDRRSHSARDVDVRASPSTARSMSSPPRAAPSNTRGDPTIIPWAQHVGVDAQKMHVMQTALFRMPEEAAALKALNEPVKTLGIILDKQSNRKHGRDSDGDNLLRVDSRERASFGQDLEPQMFRPTRKYARVGITSSIANENEGAYVDAGLAMGRSFRVGWGPGGRLVHLGALCSPPAVTTTSANSSLVTLTQVSASLSPARFEINGPSTAPLPELASKLLQHHLSHTAIIRDESNIPCAYPTTLASASIPNGNTSSSVSEPSRNPLIFSSFTSLFPTTDIFSPASIFRLGSALFDPMILRLGRSKPGALSSTIPPDLRNRATLLRRKTALSQWLENDVKSSVDADLRMQSNGSQATYTPADAAFTQLTGRQISEASNAAADGGYLKLATLISQAGGDVEFRADIREQLEIWKSEKLAPGSNPNTQNGLIARGVWRIYNLLAGLDVESGRPEDDVFVNLDWKRVFGLCLWYGTTIDASVADAVAAYERVLLRNSRGPSFEVARPVPKWATSKKGIPPSLTPGGQLGLYVDAGSWSARDGLPDDPLYTLIKLHADPALSLTNALNPRSFSPSALDLGIGMCWHLYIILSRVMCVRDFGDRADHPRPHKLSKHRGRPSMANGAGNGRAGSSAEDDDIEERPEGYSATADLLASTYAFELESLGMIQEAAFVLLHLEESAGREKAIKDLLARSGPKIDDWIERGLIGSLKLPMSWVEEAKAIYKYDSGRLYEAYELYLSAQLYNTAHTLAVYDLAPDAIIRKDLDLLRSLFTPFDIDGRRDKVEGWFVRGKVLMNYVETMTDLPRLLDNVAAENEDGEAIPDAAQQERIEVLSKGIPRLITLLPDILHRDRAVDSRHVAALEEMTKGLLKLEERARPLLLSQIQHSMTSVLDGATKINLIKGLGYARFLQSIEV